MNDLVTEYCSTCETEVTVHWNPQKDGYMIFCPSCGERLMLCDECQHRNSGSVFAGDCDYDYNTDSCRYNGDKYRYYLIHIKSSGDVLRVKTDKQEPPLELLQKLVDGYIEAVPAKHGVLIVNDVGKLYPLAMNAVATEMLRSDIHDFICGDAVLVQADGEHLVCFSKEQAQRIVDGLRKAVSV